MSRLHLPLAPDPEMERILERLRALPVIDYPNLPIAEGRAAFAATARPWNEPRPELAEVRGVVLESAGHPVPARLYRPALGEPETLVVYVHGGGWTFGSPDTHDRTVRLLAREADSAVLSVDYRLAPEHPFPAALDDVAAALDAVACGALGFHLGPGCIALAGDSAGANIVLAALIARRGKGAAPLAGAALFYGCYAPDFGTRSHHRLGDGAFGLSTERMRWYWRNYLGAEGEGTASLAAPGRARLDGLPPLYLNAAGLDPLLDDTLDLATRLAEAGVPCRLDIVPGVVHGFAQMTSELTAARDALREAGAFLKAKLRKGAESGGHP
jgi:acetyl esterase